MKLSIIVLLSENTTDNQRTLQTIFREPTLSGLPSELFIYGRPDDMQNLPNSTLPAGLCQTAFCDYIPGEQTPPAAMVTDVCRDAAPKISGDYVTFLFGGDTWAYGALGFLLAHMLSPCSSAIIMMKKIMPDEQIGAFCMPNCRDASCMISLQNEPVCYPYYFGGTFLKSSLFQSYSFPDTTPLEGERRMMLNLCAQEMQLLYVSAACYRSALPREGDNIFFADIYDPRWYEQSLTDFWIPYLQEWKAAPEGIPDFIAYHAMFSIGCRIKSNLNNRNKHVVSEGEEAHVLELIGKLLQLIDDNIMLNKQGLPECSAAYPLKWVYGILKYGPQFRFQRMQRIFIDEQDEKLARKTAQKTFGVSIEEIPHYGYAETSLNPIANLRTNILFMDYRDGRLEIDGSIHPILFSMADRIYFTLGNVQYEPVYNERYSLTKAFGISIYKAHSFHLSLPVEQGEWLFGCCAEIDGKKIQIGFSYESHFSRMSDRFKESYWCFGADKEYMITKKGASLLIRSDIRKTDRFRQELALQWNMFWYFDENYIDRDKRKNFLKSRDWLFIVIRNSYFLYNRFVKKKPIWMYLDKIYKAGDSSEYLYRYAVAKNDGNAHYYLVDKHTPDYRRLVADGYKPLVRGSILHRLVFLSADVMVISNSTVFTFNNFGMINSSYVRDLADFHVCCVQHGMSVQKIAVAQNRLRDNTRLYFCASKYEIENLSHSVYDYVGYDALKLTGVPRYDGLMNNDQKQILISPTWRMQAAVPVIENHSEGQQREYNPLFKESTYYRVYDSLINDKRLIDAAKKYGYRIKYVLHPIVSSQMKDFHKNDYVDIIPSVGEMSYEQMFRESSLMVTDFSGIQFDFAYMRKPLVYLHHKDIPQHYEEGSFFYDTMAFGEICRDNDELIDLLCEYMKDGCRMKETYVRRADDFFHYNDHDNCRRIYDCIAKYQENHILCKI